MTTHAALELESAVDERTIAAAAARRRAVFLRGDVESGQVPARTQLGQAYLQEAAHLERLTELLKPR